MALELNGSTGVSLVQDGVVTAADLASTLDLTGKTVTLPAGTGGKVLQVVSNLADISDRNTTSDSYQDAGPNVTITPTSASSKVFVMASGGVFYSAPGAGGAGEVWLEMFRNIGGGNYSGIFGTPGANAYGVIFTPYERGAVSMSLVDSPNTTSAINYKMMYRAKTSGDTAYAFGSACMIAMEIAA